MTGRTDIESTLDQFLAEGPRTVADRAVFATLAEIDRTPQRQRRFARRRIRPMFSAFRFAAAAAIAVATLGVGLLAVSGPTPPRSPVPSVGPSPTACVTAPANGQLLASDCTYTSDHLTVSMSIAGTGRFQHRVQPDRVTLQAVDVLSGGASIEIADVRLLPASPCADDGTGLPGTSPTTVDEYLEWLGTTPLGLYPTIAIEIGGLTGRAIEVMPLPLPTAAPGAPACTVIWLAGNEVGGLYVGDITAFDTRINVLDAGGRVVVVVEFGIDAPAARDALAAQLAGITFGR